MLVLLDHTLKINEKQAAIKAILDSTKEIRGYHDLKACQSGGLHFVEVHLEFSPEILLKDAHAVAGLYRVANQKPAK